MTHLVPAKQRQFAVEVVSELRAQGFQALWAGGCVRDQLLERIPGDYDVATDAKPDEIQRVFARWHTLAIGAAFGVITVVGPKEAGQIEVATFRSDVGYSDGRHPDSVRFSSPEEDAQRRDFTINGMFFDPLAEQIIDYVGGMQDLSAKVLRAIGEPRERIREDKLRMLRAVRFAAVLGFTLDPATFDAVREMADEVTVVSAERIAAEVETMLLDASRARAMQLLAETGLLDAVLPEVGPACRAGPDQSAWQRTLALLNCLAEPTFALGLAALLHGADGPELAATVGRRWRLANKDWQRAQWLLAEWDALREIPAMPWSRLQPLLIHEGIAELLALGDALAAIGELPEETVAFCRDRLALPPDELNPPPLVTGDDLLALGIPRGKLYSRLLQEIRAAQLDGRVRSKEEALLFANAVWKSL